MSSAKTLLRRRGASGAAVLLLAACLATPAAQAAPQRIVALTPFSANTLAGLGVEPVAIGQTPGGKARFSPKLRDVEELTLSHPNGPNMEELAVLNPGLVLSSPTWRKGAETMRDLDMKVVETDPRSVDDVFSQTLRIGRLVGRSARADRLETKLRRQVKRARAGIERRPRVLLLLGVGRTPFVFLRNSWGGDLVTKAGGRLVTAGVTNRSGFQRISDEAILEANPDVIVAVPHANSEDIPKIERYLRSNPAWKDTKAVRRGRFHVSGDDTLLQASTDVARVIRKLRRAYLDN